METTSAIGCDLAAEVAVKFGRVRIRAWGTSMLPAIRPGDLVWVERALPVEVCAKEIVAFAREGRLIVHRVTSSSRSRPDQVLVTRGDRLQQDDGPILDTELIGRVTHIERGGAKVAAPLTLNWRNQAIGPLLRFSDLATGLYLRLVT